jgi:hypothetical protein
VATPAIHLDRERVAATEVRGVGATAERSPQQAPLTADRTHRKGRYCPCGHCRAIACRSERRRRERIARGELIWGDLDAVLAHIELLRKTGMGVRSIAEEAGVGQTTINRMLWTFATGGRTEKVTANVARRLLSVRYDVRKLPSGTIVDSTGARRRLQALLVAGSGTRCWTVPLLAEQLGVDRMRLLKYTHMPRYSAGVCVRILDLFERLWLTEPPDVGKFSASRTRNMARRKGWVGIGAWDDDTIDDPDARPRLDAESDPNGLDENIVIDALAGRLRIGGLTEPERVEVARRLIRRGEGFNTFMRLLSTNAKTTAKYFALARESDHAVEDQRRSA